MMLFQSEKSVPKTAQTQTGLPGVPTITDRDGSGRDAILVKWSPPTVTNGQIRGYYVYYRLDNSFNDVAARIKVDDPDRVRASSLFSSLPFLFF